MHAKRGKHMKTKDAIKMGVYAQLNDMSSLDQACGRVAMVLAEAIGVLLNKGAFAHLDELEKVCGELFTEAKRAAKAKQNVQ
jgi:hypothetical protein